MNSARVTFIAGLALLGSFSCSSGRRDAPLTGPLDVSDERVATGQRVFARHCYECHPGGAAGLGPAINNKPLPGALIKTQVREGLGAMPAFDAGHISDADLEKLVAYLQALRKHTAG